MEEHHLATKMNYIVYIKRFLLGLRKVNPPTYPYTKNHSTKKTVRGLLLFLIHLRLPETIRKCLLMLTQFCRKYRRVHDCLVTIMNDEGSYKTTDQCCFSGKDSTHFEI